MPLSNSALTTFSNFSQKTPMASIDFSGAMKPNKVNTAVKRRTGVKNGSNKFARVKTQTVKPHTTAAVIEEAQNNTKAVINRSAIVIFELLINNLLPPYDMPSWHFLIPRLDNIIFIFFREEKSL